MSGCNFEARHSNHSNTQYFRVHPTFIATSLEVVKTKLMPHYVPLFCLSVMWNDYSAPINDNTLNARCVWAKGKDNKSKMHHDFIHNSFWLLDITTICTTVICTHRHVVVWRVFGRCLCHRLGCILGCRRAGTSHQPGDMCSHWTTSPDFC